MHLSCVSQERMRAELCAQREQAESQLRAECEELRMQSRRVQQQLQEELAKLQQHCTESLLQAESHKQQVCVCVYLCLRGTQSKPFDNFLSIWSKGMSAAPYSLKPSAVRTWGRWHYCKLVLPLWLFLIGRFYLRRRQRRLLLLSA